MRVAFIGMSGVGKTFWANRLAALGLACFSCDDWLIERLQAHVGPVGTSLLEVGQWLGLPISPHFAEREAVYVHHEAATLQAVLDAVSGPAWHGRPPGAVSSMPRQPCWPNCAAWPAWCIW